MLTLDLEKKLRHEKRALDPATEEMIRYCEREGIDTVFSRQAKYDARFMGLVEEGRCPFGSLGICCRQCAMGPCRLRHDELPRYIRVITPDLDKGTCGASADTMIARNLLMMITRGTAAHVGHAKHVALTLLKTARGETPYQIKNVDKLKSVASKLGVDAGQPVEKVAEEVALIALGDITGSAEAEGYMRFTTSYTPSKVASKLLGLGVVPKSAGEDIIDADHEVSQGVMSDPTSIILQGVKLGLVDITALLMSTELQDVLFGTPTPVVSKIGFRTLDPTKVNIVVHGHVPLLSEKVVEWSKNDELGKKARDAGAGGINVVGVCCTGNEVLMRQGVPLAGSNLQQELIAATGLVEAFVVDVQCIYPGVEEVAKKFHTRLITTMKEGRMSAAEHIAFEEEKADEVARSIIETAISNFPNRTAETFLPSPDASDLVAGFSVETCLSVLSKLSPDDPLKPLIDNIVSGNIYGVVLLAGCTSAKVSADASHVKIAKDLLKNNVLIVATGCAAGACARAGLLTSEAAEEFAGDKLKPVLRALGDVAGLGKALPPVWHFGSCVDNSRIVVLVAALSEKLGVAVSDLPIAASASEWVTEKACAIGTGAVALGVTTHLGITPPVLGSATVASVLTQGARDLFGGRFIVEIEPERASTSLLDHITEKRRALKI